MHREPLLDTADFERFINTVDPLLTPSRDVAWILAGRTESNLHKTKKVLAKFNMSLKCSTFATTRNTCGSFWLSAEAARHCQFEEHRASFVCLQGQGAQAHAQEPHVR